MDIISHQFIDIIFRCVIVLVQLCCGRTSDCVHNLGTFTCETVPDRIPGGVTTLIVTSQNTAMPDRIFEDTSFANLTILVINGVGLNEFNETIFVGLEHISNLTLSGMDRLFGSSLQLAMSSTGVLPKMEHFTLNPGQSFSAPFLKAKTSFLKKLGNRSMKSLTVINIISEITVFDFLYFTNLNFLNLTSCFLVLDLSSTNKYANELHNQIHHSFIKVLDVSRTRVTYVTDSPAKTNEYMSTNSPKCNGTHNFSIFPEFLLVETWYANSIFSIQTQLEGICDFSKNKVFLKSISFSGNKITKLNVTLVLPYDNSIRFGNLSDNEFKYVNPGLFNTGFRVKELYLSNNNLYNMEHLSEFEHLLVGMVQLEVFDLSNNKISFIPSNMFRTNQCLRTIFLANNRLSAILFDISHLTELRTLDVRDNVIVTLDDNVIMMLRMNIQARHIHFVVLFAGNPIQCTCESVSFISFLVSLKKVSNEQIMCAYGNDSIEVDKDAIGKCVFLCKRTLIIVVSSVCSTTAVVMLISVGLVVRSIKKRQRKRNIEVKLRQVIEAGNFMCFVAMSGNDEHLVERLIRENLRRVLQDKFGLDRDLICTGTRFKPGFPICEEAYRLMKKCQVFVAVVSASFLRSQYCQLELQEACKQNKPTILIFLGHVDIEDMPQYMQEVFRRNSRAWIKKNDDGYYYLVPSLIDISETIWDLAIADLLNNY